LIETLRDVDVAVVGNEVLRSFVARYARRTVEIPTTVAPVPLPPFARPARPVVTWMGLPDNMIHLEFVRRPLLRLRQKIDFTFRIVSSSSWERSPADVEFVEWSEEASRVALLSSTVGIAPLADDPWTRGKCALRSIQYGGHALPTVASPVGITNQVVLHGRTGYLATGERDWVRWLGALLRDPERASAMGASALAHISERYSNGVAVRAWSELIESL
jgi:glycosyltransferase involved in cell wall biosynthesis